MIAKQPRMFGYCRVSRLDQLDDETLIRLGRAPKTTGGRTSYPQQKADITTYYEKELEPKGFIWGGIVDDAGESAYKQRLCQRPGGMALCEALRPGDCVVSTIFDRLFRNHLDCMNQYSHWRLCDVLLYSLDLPWLFGTGDPLVNDMVIMFYSGCAEMESRRKRERRLNSIRAVQAVGGKIGPSKPCCYYWAGNPRYPAKMYLVEDWLEIAILCDLQRCRQLGATFDDLQEIMARAVVQMDGVKYHASGRYNGRHWTRSKTEWLLKKMQASPELQALAARLTEEDRAKLWRVDYPKILRQWPIPKGDARVRDAMLKVMLGR